MLLETRCAVRGGGSSSGDFLLTLAGLRPIEGTAGAEALAVTCGPAAGVVTNQTGPGLSAVRTRSFGEARTLGEVCVGVVRSGTVEWLRPTVGASLVLLLAGSVIVVVTSRRLELAREPGLIGNDVIDPALGDGQEGGASDGARWSP